MSAPAVDPILRGVATRLQAANGVVSLSALQAPEVGDLLGAIGLTELDIAVDGSGIAATADAVTVTGTATVLGTWTADVVTTFTVDDGDLCAALHAGLPADARVQVLGLPWAVVEDLALDLSATGPSDPLAFVTGELSGKIALDGVTDPIAVSLGPSFGSSRWVLRASDIPLPDPLAVLKTLLNDDAAPVPSSFALHDFDITSLVIEFDPEAETFHSLDIALGTTPGTTWSIAPHLELTGISLGCGVRFDETTGDPAVTVAAGATIAFPAGSSALQLPVRVVRESDQWRVGILGAHGFPSAGDLVQAIDPATAGSIPTALATLQLQSASVDVVLGADGTLRSIFFAARLQDDWEINADLKFERVAMELLVDRVSDGMSGFFAGTIDLDGVEIPVSVRKPSAGAPLTLQLATVAAPSLKGVSSLSGAAGGHDLAAHVPSGAGALPIELRNLSVAFDPQTYAPSTLDVDVRTGPWPVPGLDGFSVRDVELTLHAGWPGPAVTGRLSGTVDIPGAGISVSAAKNATDWTFTLALVPPTGGRDVRIADVIDAFAKDATPAALEGATVKTASGTFDTDGTFSIDLAGHVPIDGEPVDLELTAARKAGGTVGFGGTVTVAGHRFKLDVTSDSAATRLVASYDHDKGVAPIHLKALLAAAMSSPPDIDLTVDIKDAMFALGTDAAATHAVFGLELVDIDLSGLPLVGKALRDAAKVEELQVVAGDIELWNAVRPQSPLAAQGDAPAVIVSGQVALGDTTMPIALPAATPAPTTTTTGAPATPDGTKWLAIQRAFGPVQLDRVGARYDAGALWLVLDGSLSLGGLSLSLIGLGVGSELSAFDPRFHLDGLGLAFAEGGVEIAGSFLAVSGKDLGEAEFEYDGSAVVKAESFTLAAIGSYAQVLGRPSLFVFAELDTPLGGPPAFYVTGLMGGFGYNRSLRIPGQDQLFQFPFIKGLDPGASPRTSIDPWLTDEIGEDWLAAGVTFTSFDLVETRALLIAEFGLELQFALLGLSKMKLPQEGSESFAYLELELEALLKPNDGFFGLTAVLSPNSYVIDRSCRLTGGFAFYVWFGGDHAGDFVITLGGYHPAFSPPAHYPSEPRLALSWPVDDLVTVSGEAYFALTPSCVMGGGALRLLFHDGNLQAWLTASADFLIAWRPFRYAASVGVSVGVSYRIDVGFAQKTLSAELAVQLDLWGPPTGGLAHVSWYIISFDIAFGAGPPSVPEVQTWADFQPLLPADGDWCKVAVQSGLLADTDGGWRVRAGDLALATECAIPASELLLGRNSYQKQAAASAPGIRPLRLATFDSTHTLTVTGPRGSVDLLDPDAKWDVQARTRDAPAALWGRPLTGDQAKPPPSAELVKDQLVGFVISPPATHGPDGVVVDMDSGLSPVPLTPGGELPFTGATAPARAAASDRAIDAVGAIASAAPARAAVRSALAAQGLDPGTDDVLDAYAKQSATLFPNAPMLAA